MRCGNCHQQHDTVMQVRTCYGVSGATMDHQVDHQAEHDWREEPATIKQLELLQRLRDEHGVDAMFTGLVTKGQAHLEIERLYKMPKHGPEDPGRDYALRKATYEANEMAPVQVRASTDRWDDIPQGYYATVSLTGNNDLDFWKVDRPTEGKWAGYLFMNRVIGGRKDTPVRGGTKRQALKAIRDAGPEKAMALFGQELGRCGKCGRTLTDEESRRIGIGPVCRA